MSIRDVACPCLHFVADQTRVLIDKGSTIKIEGALGAFEDEFEEMEEKLNRVEQILGSQNVTEEHLDDLTQRLDQIRLVACCNAHHCREVWEQKDMLYRHCDCAVGGPVPQEQQVQTVTR